MNRQSKDYAIELLNKVLDAQSQYDWMRYAWCPIGEQGQEEMAQKLQEYQDLKRQMMEFIEGQ